MDRFQSCHWQVSNCKSATGRKRPSTAKETCFDYSRCEKWWFLRYMKLSYFLNTQNRVTPAEAVVAVQGHTWNERIPQQHILPFLNPRGLSWTKLTMEAKFISISSRKCTGICLSFHPKLRLVWLCVNCFTKNTPICGFLHLKAKQNILRSVFNLLNVPLNFSVSLISSGSICVIAFFLRF